MLFMKDEVEIYPLGECAATIRFGVEWTDQHRHSIFKIQQVLEKRPFPGMVECVPAFVSLTVYYDPMQVIAHEGRAISPFQQVKQWLKTYMREVHSDQIPQYKEVQIPVIYGGKYGPDLAEAAAYCHLSEEEFIERHTRPLYTVQMIGFAPGFPYLAGMDESIAIPRKKTPRSKVSAGSVGIAGKQTGVYTIDSPGGWNIIGWTPLSLFRPQEDPPVLLQAGMRIRFYSTDENGRPL